MHENPFPLETDSKPSPSKGKNSAAEQGSNIPKGWKPTLAKPIPVVRCTAPVRNGPNEGEQCPNWSLRGATVCLQHGGHLPVVKEKAAANVESARKRMLGLTPSAMDVIEEIMMNGTQEAIRLKAATEILDRAGVTKGPEEVKVEVNHSVSQAEEIQKRIAIMSANIKLEDLGERRRQQAEEEDEIIDEPSETD